jgi:hypothetical protein
VGGYGNGDKKIVKAKNSWLGSELTISETFVAAFYKDQ